jgi:hypothetical protein
MHVITIPGSSSEPRLTPEEIEEFFHFAYATHDHEARTPAEPIFWYRSGSDLGRFEN